MCSVLIKKEKREMLRRNWKRIGMIILIVACIFNVMGKLIHKLSLNKEMLYSAEYMQGEQTVTIQK